MAAATASPSESRPVASSTFNNIIDSGNGTRVIVNGHAYNNGNPTSTGDWNGEAQKALERGAVVIWGDSQDPPVPWTPHLGAGSSVGYRPMEAITGSYKGNGTTGRTISLGFQPRIVVVEGSDGTQYDIREGMTKGGVGSSPSGELSIASDGFTVGDNSADADPNTDTESYSYWAAG